MLHYIFKNLPDVLIQNIIDYTNETPFRKLYDEKNRKWIRKTNPQFALLNKVCKFMINHPPDYYTLSDYYNPNYYNHNFMNRNPKHIRFDTIHLTITLPIKADDGYKKYTMAIRYDGTYVIFVKKLLNRYKY